MRPLFVCPRGARTEGRRRRWTLTKTDSRRDVIEARLPPGVLPILLKDHSTGNGMACRNIRWATRDYVRAGVCGFGEWDEMRAATVARCDGGKLIQPRVDKSLARQRERSVSRAEVFTPSWICNCQNNLVDAAWFGRKAAPFNRELDVPDLNGLLWRSTGNPVRFTVKKKNRTWLDYVTALRLEVTCGEAPYLTSRYDAVSGRFIEPPDRIGLLDRKLRIVGEHAASEREWIALADRALKSVYGYEFQGDNVLIARENVLESVREFRAIKFKTAENLDDVIRWAKIVSWNIWQMDGIKYTVPGPCPPVSGEPDMFGECPEPRPCPGCASGDPLKHTGRRCRIMDWEKNCTVSFMPPFDFQPTGKGEEL